MAEPNDDDVLARYTARVMALKDERHLGFDEATLRSIAADLGMSEADLAAVRAAAFAHRARGEGYCEHGRYDDAIVEFEQACTLTPLDVGGLHALAEAHLARFSQQRDAKDKDAARALARRCLAIDPQHDPSFKLLNALDALTLKAAPARHRAVAAAAVGVVVVAVGAAGWFISRAPALVPPVEVPVGVPVAVAVAAVPLPVEAPAADLGEGNVSAVPAAGQLPIKLIDSERTRGLHLDVRQSTLARYPDSTFYTLQALLRSERPTEIQQVKWQLDLVDAGGAVLQSEAFAAPADHQAALRPGDLDVVTSLVKTRADVVAARLVALAIEEDPASSSYPPSPPVELLWTVPKPAGVDVVVRQRSQALSAASFGLGPYFKATYEVENAGTAPLRTLKLELRFLDGAGVIQGKNDRLVTFSGTPAMRAHEVRLERFTSNVGPTFVRAVLAVVEVE